MEKLNRGGGKDRASQGTDSGVSNVPEGITTEKKEKERIKCLCTGEVPERLEDPRSPWPDFKKSGGEKKRTDERVHRQWFVGRKTGRMSRVRDYQTPELHL